MSRTAEKIDQFPQTESNRREAVILLARQWRSLYPGFEIKTSVPVKDICSEPDDEDLKGIWREESFDVLVLAGTRVAVFQILREDPKTTEHLVKAIGRIVREHEQRNF